MDENIINFVKKKIIKEKINNDTTDTEKKANEEMYHTRLKEWLKKQGPKAKNCKKASHVGNFTHPDADNKSYVFFTGHKSVDGFLRSGNVNTKPDFVGSATFFPIIEFLNIEITGNSLLKHLEENSDDIQKQFSFLSKIEYKNIRENLLQVNITNNEAITGSEIKQIYFPVDNAYHLLSVLTPSGIILALKEKIEDMRKKAKEAKEDKKKAEQNEIDFSEIYPLTLISYGGGNPQNISNINVQLKKKSYILPSIPPKLHKKKIKLPKYDFFKESLNIVKNIKAFEDIFYSFHKLQNADWNNQKIRVARDNWIKTFLDQVLDSMWLLRQESPGWSTSRNKLPFYQKQWLDNYYQSERESSEFESNLDKVMDDISRHFIFSYEKVLGKNRSHSKNNNLLSDNMWQHIRKISEHYKEYLR